MRLVAVHCAKDQGDLNANETFLAVLHGLGDDVRIVEHFDLMGGIMYHNGTWYGWETNPHINHADVDGFVWEFEGKDEVLRFIEKYVEYPDLVLNDAKRFFGVEVA